MRLAIKTTCYGNGNKNIFIEEVILERGLGESVVFQVAK